MTKSAQLLAFCRQKKVLSYVDVNDWMRANYYLRAPREIRKFVEEGKLRRIPDEEAILRNLRKVCRAAVAWFEVIE